MKLFYLLAILSLPVMASWHVTVLGDGTKGSIVKHDVVASSLHQARKLALKDCKHKERFSNHSCFIKKVKCIADGDPCLIP
ncbi:hypothetical protein [Celerinatantimonas sp. MCCC 1A17872]|uniref:hypothetical protein n=1 Tax=Celerinatantimonas sp. MCCC 1A17872 TaxID=3177514 RepID=UPI0038C0917F